MRSSEGVRVPSAAGAWVCAFGLGSSDQLPYFVVERADDTFERHAEVARDAPGVERRAVAFVDADWVRVVRDAASQVAALTGVQRSRRCQELAKMKPDPTNLRRHVEEQADRHLATGVTPDNDATLLGDFEAHARTIASTCGWPP
jgi:hypothetical protein